MEKKTWFSIQWIDFRFLWILILLIHRNQHLVFLEIPVLIISHWCDDLLNQLVERLYVAAVRQELHDFAKFNECTDYHLQISFFDLTPCFHLQQKYIIFNNHSLANKSLCSRSSLPTLLDSFQFQWMNLVNRLFNWSMYTRYTLMDSSERI